MDLDDKLKFVCDLVEAVKKDMLGKLTAGKVPAEWDGHELRCWLAEEFDREASGTVLRREKRSHRTRQYRNAILINNL